MPRVLVDLLSYTGTKGGMETYARELYRQLGAMKSEFEFVALASREGYELDQSWFPGEVVPSGISGENRFIWAYGELLKVTGWAKRLKADLIHSPATLGTMRRGVPSVVTMHDMLYWSHPDLMSTGFYTGPVKWMERRAAKAASRVMTISQVSRDEILRYLHVDPARLDVVPLAGTRLPQVARTARARTAPFILATGNRRPHKNWAGLIRALPHVDESIRPRLVITGSHGDDPLLPVVAESKMGKWVDLKSWVSSEEMSALYSEATIMAMPSFCDGFCLPALEAMMVGLPVMLSDISVYREVADEAALYFDPSSPESIANAISIAVTDGHRMAELSELGKVRSSTFSWARTAEGTLETFRAALRDR